MIMPENSEFRFNGFNHVSLLCDDMARTVDFYSGILGLPLVKTVDLPKRPGGGQQFAFDVGNGNTLVFFWLANRPEARPGSFNPPPADQAADMEPWFTAISSVNHLAFDVPPERFDEYYERLKAKGVVVGPIRNHDDSETQEAAELHPGVYSRSFYFRDPDGILLEFACWTREFTEDDVAHAPKRAADRVVAAQS
ncbi:VOC family protein [Nocardia africana]|uniref:VOC family protein n=1 Tax=Nocardia africana TaxID=134964 RepID=A0ABW6NP98_9NOCA